jgi:predicted MFS family arabinose efflux permease
MQTVVGYTPFEASLVMVPLSVIMLFLAGRFGKLADERGPRLFLTTGPALMAAGMLAWLGLAERSDWLPLAAGVVLFALGLAVTVAPITATALSAVPSNLAGVAAGFNNTVSRVGGLLAVALIGLVISAVFTGAVDGSSISPLADPPTSGTTRDASIDAFRAGLLVAAALSLLGSLVAAVGISDPEARAEAHPAPA